MSLTLIPASPGWVKNAVNLGVFTFKGTARLLHLTFICGPRLLLTTQLSAKNASLMILLCAPALLFCSMLIIPAMIFQSPQQQAYFYFAQILNQDPIRWVILAFAGVCAVMALAVPAMVPKPFTAVRY